MEKPPSCRCYVYKGVFIDCLVGGASAYPSESRLDLALLLKFVAKTLDPVFVRLVTEQRNVLRSFRRQIDGNISTNSKLLAFIHDLRIGGTFPNSLKNTCHPLRLLLRLQKQCKRIKRDSNGYYYSNLRILDRYKNNIYYIFATLCLGCHMAFSCSKKKNKYKFFLSWPCVVHTLENYYFQVSSIKVHQNQEGLT